MKEQMHWGSLNRISEIAYQCLQIDREKRPSMCVVVKKLKEALKVHEMIDGSPTDFEETNRISHSPPLEHNSDEEDAMSVYLLGEKC
ncbi:hypothetical protein HanLR1_Chr08g0280321 [Helianthus annuus]|nr:hypothetical protein HanHA89_Chr08g0298771 [Helianthus annuus]KAJ0719318.1 hypothetical protein HanLR1_Chr08g0280321 [Helianthus annuus]